MLRSKFSRIFPVLLLFIIISFLFSKVLFPPEGKIIYGGDVQSQFYFWKGYLAENIRQGIIPFWNPYNFSGTPFLAHPSTAFFYPGNLIFYVLPLNMSFSWYFFVHFLIAAAGMYLCARIYADKLSAMAAPVIFVLSGFFSSRVYAGHVDILSAAAWIPWVFWSVVRFLGQPSGVKFFLMVMLFSLEILAGYQAFVIFTLEFIILYLMFNLLKSLKTPARIKKLIPLYIFVFIAFFLSLGITGVQWLPTAQLVNHSIRKDGLPYPAASWGSLPLSAVKLFITPFDANELSKISYGFTEGILPNFFDYYLGSVTLTIVFAVCFVLIAVKIFPKIRTLFGMIFKSNFAEIWPLVLAGLIFLYISFGHFAAPNLHYLLYKLTPVYRFFRIPDQHLVMVVFTVALVFAVIMNNLRHRELKFFIIAAVVVQLFYFSQRFFILSDIPGKTSSLIETVRDSSSLTRFLPHYRVYEPLKNVFEFNSGMRDKIFSVSGYDPIILYDYYRFLNLANKITDTSASITQYNVEIAPIGYLSNPVRFLGIKYVLSGKNFDSRMWGNGSLETVLGSGDYSLTIDKSASERIHFAPYARIFPSVSDAEVALVGNADLSKEVLITDPAKPDFEIYRNEACKSGDKFKIEKVSYGINNIDLSVNSGCDGYLVTSDVLYPGWQAEVDQIPVPVIRSNIAFRSIFLAKGAHKVRFFYFPYIYILGGLISLISLITTGFCLMKVKYQKNSHKE